MAKQTINYQREQKRALRKARFKMWLKNLPENLKNWGEAFGIVILAIIIFFLFALPPCFYVCSLVVPGAMVDLCLNETFGDFVHELNVRTIRCLPWYARKKFMASLFQGHSARSYRRYFQKINYTVDYLKTVPKYGQDYIWNKGDNRDREMLISTGWYYINKEQFVYLLEQGMYGAVQSYITAHAPTKESVIEMLKKSDVPDVQQAIILYTEKHGLKEQGLLETALSYTKNNAEFQAKIAKAQRIKAQKSHIDKCKDMKEFANWCRTVLIEPEAQVCMSLQQYEVFHASGQKLSDEAVIAFVSAASEVADKNAQTRLAKVFAYETLSQKSRSYVESSSDAQRVISKMMPSMLSDQQFELLLNMAEEKSVEDYLLGPYMPSANMLIATIKTYGEEKAKGLIVRCILKHKLEEMLSQTAIAEANGGELAIILDGVQQELNYQLDHTSNAELASYMRHPAMYDRQLKLRFAVSYLLYKSKHV